MKTSWVFVCMLCCVTCTVYGQLRLNVQGSAAIEGNLFMGNPEGSILGLDQLIGFNDLRFATGDPNTTDMLLTEDGKLGLGTGSPVFALHIEGDSPSLNIGLGNTGTNGKTYSFYSTNADNTEGGGAFMIRDESAGANRFFINTDGRIGIGTIAPENNKLSVVADANSARVISALNDNTAGGEQIAVLATANGSGDGTRIGTFGRVVGDGGTGQHFGLYGLVGTTNATNITVGVFGSTLATGTGTPYAGYFAGDVTVTGTFDNPSDEKLKTEVRNLGSALDRVMALNPVSYRYRTQEFPQMQLAEGQQMGFIAQDVEAIFPELVKKNRHPETVKSMDETGNTSEWYPGLDYKGVNYLGLIPVLTRATQEQQEEILDLRAENSAKDRRIAELEDRLARLERVVEQLATNGSSAHTVPLTDASLLQNQPNPFTRETLINYAIPNMVNRAELRITDVNGRLLKTVIIDQRGEGQTRLQAQSLSAGTYFYSLVLDGAVLETRKMVLTK